MIVSKTKFFSHNLFGWLVPAILFFGLCASANASAPLIYAYDLTNKRLVTFRADNPTVLRSSVTVSGLNANETLSGIDFRPSNGKLYATGSYFSNGSTFFRLLTINPWTGIATVVPAQQQYTTTAASFSLDFSPTGDQIRQTNDINKNYRMNPDTGMVVAIDTDLAFVSGDPGGSSSPQIVHTAYGNNYAGATATTLYGLSYSRDSLVRIGGVNGSPSPSLGQVTTVGSLGVVTSFFYGGFDIQAGTNNAYAALRVDNLSKLYRINLSTGAATPVGNIGSGTAEIDGLAIAPPNTPFDFDGDGKTEISFFRSAPSEWWYSKSSDGVGRAIQFGTSTDKLIPGDYTGDGKADIAVWRESTGQWFILRSEDNSFYAFPFGAAGDIPVPADYDGDGRTDSAVYRPSNNVWYLNRSRDGSIAIPFGVSGDKPVVSDYDGDGKSDVAIFRPNGANGAEWWINRSASNVYAVQFGTSTDKAVQGDYTGDGKSDIAFWRPAGGYWYILRSEDNSFYGFSFGASDDKPVAADYDGDGKFDAAVFRPSISNWFIVRSSGGVYSQAFGIPSDIPVPGVYIP